MYLSALFHLTQHHPIPSIWCQMTKFIPFCGWIVFDISLNTAFSLFTHWWTLRLILYLRYYEQHYNTHVDANVSSTHWLHFLWIQTRSRTAISYGSSISIVLRNSSFPLWLYSDNSHLHLQCMSVLLTGIWGF